MSGYRLSRLLGMMAVFAAAAIFAAPASGSGMILAQAEDSGPALGDTQDETEEDDGDDDDEQSGQEAEEETDTPEEKPDDLPGDTEELYREIRDLKEKVESLEREAEAREELEVSEEEEKDDEEQVLEAAGREYSLMEKGTLGLELNTSYSYTSYDAIREEDIEYKATRSLTNELVIESARRDNLTIDAQVPFEYKYDKSGTERSKDVTNIGDMSLGAKYQPFKKTAEGVPSPIVNARLTFPSGKGSYDIDPDRELSTGSGIYRLSTGVSASQSFDPINAFGSLNYSHGFKKTDIGQNRSQGRLEEVDPGDSISVNMGFGYAVSYKMSLSLSWSYTYSFSTDYTYADGTTDSSGSQDSSSLSLSTAWRLTPTQTIIIGISAGLTNDDSDFGFSLRLPFEFGP